MKLLTNLKQYLQAKLTNNTKSEGKSNSITKGEGRLLPDKDTLIVEAAQLLRECLNHAKELPWESAYFRHVEYSPAHDSQEISYIANRELAMSGSVIERNVRNQYLDAIAELLGKLFRAIEQEGVQAPVVAVLKVTPAGEYNLKFDYDCTNALEINLLRVGLDNSYFAPDDLHIPERHKERQRKLAED